jgi:predicted ATPase
MLIQQLTLTNLLSFGPNTEPLELRPLNIVIGPNGSGKSNLLEAVDLLRNTPDHIARPIREGGGIQDWLWKGEKARIACIDAELAWPLGISTQGVSSLRYVIKFGRTTQDWKIVDEHIANGKGNPAYTYYRFYLGRSALVIAHSPTVRIIRWA